MSAQTDAKAPSINQLSRQFHDDAIARTLFLFTAAQALFLPPIYFMLHGPVRKDPGKTAARFRWADA
jgi:hypothetical protein